jgi:hypothetical protein
MAGSLRGNRLRAMLMLVAALFPPIQCDAAGSGRNDFGDGLILEVRPEKDRAYLHERVPVTVTLLAGPVSARNIQYPRLRGPGFGAMEFGPPRQKTISRNGIEYTAHEFATIITPLVAGRLELGPAEIRCDVPAPASGAAAFFGGGEPRSVALRSEPASLTVLPLPALGRPVGFAGAVGRFTVTRRATPTEVRIGNPITVITRVGGVGDFDSHACEPIELSGVRVYPPRMKRTKNQLSCEQVLFPETATDLEIPAAVISFFDPLTGGYATSKSTPIRLTAAPTSQPKTGPTAAATREPPGPGSSGKPDWLMWGSLTGALAVAATVFHLVTRRRRMAPAAAPDAIGGLNRLLAEADAALADADPRRFYGAAFRLAQAAAAGCLNLPRSGMTAGSLNVMTESGDCPESLCPLLGDVFHECDAFRYGRSIRDRSHMARTFKQLELIVSRIS